MDLLVGFHVQHVAVRHADQIEIMHECAECEGLLFGDGEAESIGDKRRIKTDAASMIEQVTILGFQEIGDEGNQRRRLIAMRHGERSRAVHGGVVIDEGLPSLGTGWFRAPECRRGGEDRA